VAKATAGQSFVVTTGTGSGKSLCFFVPIIDSAIRARAAGEALDPFQLTPLGRYEVHLDRKLERMLSMLLKLKELRSDPADP
jgi:ATP-dependent helicase YprA (DUF1998 family)